MKKVSPMASDKHVEEYEMKTKIALLSLLIMVFSGCATPPSKSELDGLPVVEFGEAVPASGDYILYFPADQDIPTNVGIEGDIFQQPAQHVLKVKLKRDIYNYKEWMSYDKQHWLYGRDALGFNLDIKIPGYHYPKPGSIKINMSEKKSSE